MSSTGSVTRLADPGRPSTQLRPAVLYYPDTTATFHASVFKYNNNPYTNTLVVNCVTSCGSNGIPEQTVTVQVDSSISFAGNHVLSGSRTAWGFGKTLIQLSSPSSYSSYRYAATTAKDGERLGLPVSSSEVPDCFLALRIHIVTVTAGLDRIYGWGTYYDNSDVLPTQWENALSQSNCTSTADPGTTQTGSTSASGVAETGSKTTTAGVATATKVEGSGSRFRAPKGLLVLGIASFIWLLV